MGSFYMEATQINYRRDETLKTVDQKLQELSEESAVDTDIAPVFSKTATYNPGDLVYYKNRLYVCVTQHTGAWAAADFTASTVSAELGSLKSGLTNLDNEVNGDATTYPYADVITIEDAVPANVADCNVKIEPVQDMHGYDKPWVGGAGKNKLPLVLADIKSANTDGTWSGNAYTINGVTFTVQTDADGNVTGININGTTTSGTTFNIANNVSIPINGTYKFMGNSNFSSGVAANTFIFGNASEISTYNNAVTRTISDNFTHAHIYLWSGKTLNNIMVYPMFMLASESSDDFAPYTNICPISGHTEASVQVADDAENPTVTKTYTIALGDTIYGGTVDFDTGLMTVTHGINVVRSNNIDGETALSNNITRFRCVLSIDILSGGANSVCSHFPYLESWDDPTPHFYTQTSYAYCFAPGNGAQEVKAYIEEQYDVGKPITICSKLKNTFTVQLTPQQIQLLKGQNTLTASTGDISVTVNGVSGAIGSVQEQVNATDEALAELAEKLPTAPTTDGAYVLTVTVADGTPTYSWESAT